ncbi:MAG: TRAP transporter small permease subunit [Deltaproteobacteria bacterium]|nr:TRAP transporter small permease subunit [Deltaproteobacteria bacterium]
MYTLKIFIRIVDKISEWTGKATMWLIMAMVFVVSYEVVFRYFFNSPTVWAYDMAIFMFGYAGLWAGAYALKNGYHITVDIVYSQLSTRWKAILDVFTGLLGFFFLILVIVMNWEPAITAIINNQTTDSYWGPPAGHYKLMIPLSGFFFLMQGIANWFRSLYKAITNRELDT